MKFGFKSEDQAAIKWGLDRMYSSRWVVEAVEACLSRLMSCFAQGRRWQRVFDLMVFALVWRAIGSESVQASIFRSLGRRCSCSKHRRPLSAGLELLQSPDPIRYLPSRTHLDPFGRRNLPSSRTLVSESLFRAKKSANLRRS
jgi:hypothetical protein